MISAEAPVLFSKACELFIQDLTLRAWDVAVQDNRKVLQKADIAAAIQSCELFDFLEDVVTPSDELQHLSASSSATPIDASPPDADMAVDVTTKHAISPHHAGTASTAASSGDMQSDSKCGSTTTDSAMVDEAMQAQDGDSLNGNGNGNGNGDNIDDGDDGEEDSEALRRPMTNPMKPYSFEAEQPRLMKEMAARQEAAAVANASHNAADSATNSMRQRLLTASGAQEAIQTQVRILFVVL
jgi:Histone-like transcription factor (CBF/NF-Y) and archaeal histone